MRRGILFGQFKSKSIKQLIGKGIDKNNIIGMWPFGGLIQFTYSYYAQWNYLINNQDKTKIDFIITGNSFFKYGIDISTMSPFNGINFSRDSQDLYYSLKMVQAYFDTIKNNQYPKFCLIGLAPYAFNNWLDFTIRNFDQYFYFPIIGHNNMEYQGTKRGEFLKKIFRSKYKKYLKMYLNKIDSINLNDIDGSRQWHQEHNFITARQQLKAADELAIYEHKKYPETVEQNKRILSQYIEMCLNHNVKPIGVLLPFSEVGRKHYPKTALKEFFETLEPFLEKMSFINLWDMKLPDSNFEDITHLKISGSIEVTKKVKEQILKILDSN